MLIALFLMFLAILLLFAAFYLLNRKYDNMHEYLLSLVVCKASHEDLNNVNVRLLRMLGDHTIRMQALQHDINKLKKLKKKSRR